MKAVDVPERFPIPFGNNAGIGYIRVVPEVSQIGIQDGAASLRDGFPPLCFLPSEEGGSWPWGQDANGILNQITAWNRWASAGGPVGWDFDFSVAIGGFPKGGIVAADTFGHWWISTVDDNLTDPDANGAGWSDLWTLAMPNPAVPRVQPTLPVVTGANWSWPVWPETVGAQAGIGQCKLNMGAIEYAYLSTLPGEEGTGEVWVDWRGRDEGSGGPADPIQSLAYAVNFRPETVVHVAGGPGAVYEPTCDAQPGIAMEGLKHVIFHGPAIIRRSGDVLAEMTWTVTGGRTGIYETTCSADRVPIATVITTEFDEFGFPARLRGYFPFQDGPIADRLDLLEAAGLGWTFDSDALKYYVAGFVMTTSQKTSLRAVWTISGQLIRAQATRMIWEGPFWLEGCDFYATDNASGRAELYLVGGTSFCALEEAVHAQGGLVFAEDMTFHAMANDGLHSELSEIDADHNIPRIVLYNSIARYSGDPMTYGNTYNPVNNQPFSSHTGLALIVGSILEGGYGQCLAQTTGIGQATRTWAINSIFRAPLAPPGSRIGAIIQGSALGPENIAWFDTCSFNDCPDGDLIADSGGGVGTIKIYNVQYSSSTGPVTQYDPGAPG